MKSLYKDCVILDVRDPYEYRQGHIQSAVNIPFDQIVKSIPFNRFTKLAVYSCSGYHSKAARKLLEKMGYEVDDLGDYDSLKLPKEEQNRTQPDRIHHIAPLYRHSASV